MNMNKTKGIVQQEFCWSLRFFVALDPYMGGHQPARNHYHQVSTFFESFPNGNNSQDIANQSINFLN